MQKNNMPDFGIKNNNGANQSSTNTQPDTGAARSSTGMAQSNAGAAQPNPNTARANKATPQSFSNQPFFSSTSETFSSPVNSQPFGSQSIVTSSTDSRPITSKKSKSLTKEQILTLACAGLGVITLILLITTIAVATAKPKVTNTAVVERVNLDQISTATLGFYTDKIENAAENSTYKMSVTEKNSSGNTILSATINPDNSGVIVNINWEFVSEYYKINVARNDQETFDIKFDKPVADLTIGHPTVESSDNILLLLLADGTIEYVPIAEALQRRAIQSNGKLSDITDVVKFYQADLTESYETSPTTLVQKTSGEIIDLRRMMLQIIHKDSQ